MRQVTHVLLTRPPLKYITILPLDLHVLGTPPAFVLSQDQTLMLNSLYPSQTCLAFYYCVISLGFKEIVLTYTIFTLFNFQGSMSLSRQLSYLITLKLLCQLTFSWHLVEVTPL